MTNSYEISLVYTVAPVLGKVITQRADERN
jgi:hypothetical protein